MKRNHTYSQNFIRRPQLVKTLIGHSTLHASDIVYDIGAGSGIITSSLAKACKHVVALEVDARMVAKLKDNTKHFTNVEIIHADILTFPLPSAPYKVFSNIPFHLSSPILRRLTEAPEPPEAIYLIVQKQFAKKLIIDAKTPFTGMLGAMVAPWFHTRIRYKLEKTDFLPSPAVDTAFVELLKRDTPLLPRQKLTSYNAFVEQCYSRQKYFATLSPLHTKGKRPSQLTAEEWSALYSASQK